MHCEFCGSGMDCSVCGREPPNARFWVYERGGWVKITLRPGQSLSVCTGGDADEGYHWEAVRWLHEGTHVTCEYTTWGRDCDGRHEYHSVRACKLGELKGMDHEDPESGERLALPVWERADESQRDYSAEAAGY